MKCLKRYSEITTTGTSSVTFLSDGSNLVDYTIYGASGGVGDKTVNVFDKRAKIFGYYDTATGDFKSTTNFKLWKEKVNPGDTVRWTIPAAGKCYFYNGEYISKIDDNVDRTFIVPNDADEVAISFRYDNWNTSMIVINQPLPSTYIPYGYQIPLTINSQTYTIYLDSPLGEGESISLAEAGIQIPTTDGENILTVDTTVAPTSISVTSKAWQPIKPKRFDGTSWVDTHIRRAVGYSDRPVWHITDDDTKILYGYHIDGATGDVTYIPGTDNETYTPAAMGSTTFDYGSWENAFFKPKPCMLKSNGTVDYYLDPNDYSKKLDGTASDVSDPTYDGNAMIEFPKIYYAAIGATEGGSVDIYIANYKVDDRFECWCNYDANNNEIEHFYVAAYNAVILDGKMRSLSGYALTQENGADSTTAAAEIAAARANNQNGVDEWYTYLIADHQLLTYLATLMCKHVDHQPKFGKGIDTGSQVAKRSYVTGTVNDKGLFWGDTSTGTQAVKIFGIENFYACVWKRAAGLIGTSTGYAYKLTHGTKDGSTATSFNTNGSDYKTITRTKPSSGHITTMHYESDGFWIPATTGTNRYGDYYWNGNGYALAGGASYSGVYYGSWSIYLYYGVGTRGWDFSSALSCKPLAPTT